MPESKVALITGAGSGVGRAAALQLAAAGFHVALVGRTQSKLAETQRQITAQSPASQTHLFAVDISAQSACQHIVAQTVQTFGRLDALANVAGHAQVSPIEKITADQWQQTIGINVSAVMYLTSAAWPHFRRTSGGVIVNVSSMASLDPFPGFGMYAPTKAALNMFTLITAREGQDIGLRAVGIAPGAIETPMLRGFFDEKMIPKHKTLDPMQVAAVIRDCITGARPFTSGETIPMPSPH